MSADSPVVTATYPSAAAALREIKASWPLLDIDAGDGYRPLPVASMQPIDAWLVPGGVGGSARFVLVVRDQTDRYATLPVVSSERGWRLANDGDGLSQALVNELATVATASPIADGPGFRLERFLPLPAGLAGERRIRSDQTNRSVVIGTDAIVKWRTSFAADGERSRTLRRHLQAAGFDGAAPFLGALRWIDRSGRPTTLADIDTYLPAAVDGWDHHIAVLHAATPGSAGGSYEADQIGRRLGVLTGSMHASFARPTTVIAGPVVEAQAAQIEEWHPGARAALEAVLAIQAPDRDHFSSLAGAIGDEIDSLLSIRSCKIQPVHGDLHLGQLVVWAGGMAYIDFDGPPSPRQVEQLDRQPAARDVAQMLCSLDNLAAVVDARTEGLARSWLQGWARSARAGFLEAYQARLSAAGMPYLLDERLLAPFEAEQFCRELLYAAEVLPRWRYAPMTALTWRYPRIVT